MNAKQKVRVMMEIKELVMEWIGYVKDMGNECAYTDSILEKIQEKLNKVKEI